MDTSGLTTIKRTVLKYLERNRLPMSEYIQVFGLVCSAMRELHLFTVKNSRTIKLKMDAVNCLSLPEDYLSFVKLGVPVQGRLWSFTLDNNIIVPQSLVNGLETLNQDIGEGQGKSESYMGYNTTGGYNDFYMKFDLPNRRIIVNGLPRTECTLVYKSNGVSASGQTLISGTYEEAILAFVNWKRAESERNMSWCQKFEMDYNGECNKLKFLEGPTLDQIYDAIYSTYRIGPKR